MTNRQPTRGRGGHRHRGLRAGLPLSLMGAAVLTALVAAAIAGLLALHSSAAARPLPTDFRAPETGNAPAVLDTGSVEDAPPENPPVVLLSTPTAAIEDQPPAPAGSASPTPERVEPVPAATPAATASPTPAPAIAAAGANLPASAALSAAPPPLEHEHTVAPNETLSGIAQRYGLTTDTLIMNNAGVTDRDMLKVGQKLRIPPRDGLLYEIRLGESIAVIAKRYGIDPAAVVNEPANRLTSADVIRQGQVILLPGAKAPIAPPAPSPSPVRPVPAVTAPPVPALVRAATATAPPVPVPAALPLPSAAPAAPAPAAAPASRAGFAWPITGPISSYFGPSHPLGIDIDLYGRDGAPVTASRAGVITFAGGNPCCSYGYYVEIDHGDGYRTVYGHFQSPPPVSIGQHVSQGQIVGYAGTTGYSTGTHLHFEIRQGDVPVNPLAYLP